MSDFKDRLRAERKRLGLSQEKFAALAGVTKDTQLNYESGARKPDSDYLMAICDAGVDSHFLLHGTPSSDELLAEESELLLGFRKLDLRGKLRLLGLVEGMSEGAAPAPAATPQVQRKQKITIKGAVGHQVNGDVTAPMTVNVANKKSVK
ncbi:helix-turn-helix domain-containing protein [Janthinobacterium sp. 1_2014MBL_MicDiv]|uniref:helix-turn-helix domain-containing protein n=1 Tax=Janthinobacterium sp. 1_2014MBL_MicDiv TaxID=1644131 RepID=UPI0009F6F188|nr:helix-turn-helix transcriptional regulator [Janthinobacterium sp. 1_2014MBL_MicDiv]